MSKIYDAARFYSIAFGWRNVRAECDFMLERYAKAHDGAKPCGVLEVACGPGEHARQFAARYLPSIGLDINPLMLEYAKKQPGGDDPDISWLQADMRDFTLSEPVALAYCLVDSLSHLLSLDDLLAHLAAMARNMSLGGLYILEQSHPRDAFAYTAPGMEPSWEIEDESGEIVVYVTWGEEDDPFDFTTQIGLLTVTLIAHREGKEIFRQRDIIPSRLWLAGEIEAAVRASGPWQIRERFGAMDSQIAWQSTPPAFRMVTVLEKIQN